MQPGEHEFFGRLAARQAADQRGQKMPLLLQLPLQRRQRLLDLRQRGLLRHHVRLRDLAGGNFACASVET